MKQNAHSLYKAYLAKDQRFDGVFYMGVTSTGIYCRPICTARTAREENCRFFESAMAAEKAGFRACLRCRPELAPGNAPVDDPKRIADLLIERLQQGRYDGKNHEEIAREFELSPRQLRRILDRQLGVSLMELLQARRLQLARKLLNETLLPVTEIAHASGFASLRRFNSAFLSNYKMSPRELRKKELNNA